MRGEGAILVNDRGERFMADIDGTELAPRDVVARAISAQLSHGRRVFLDARRALGEGFASRFPTIHRLCAEASIDPARDLVPVRPAAHYHMGGVATDLKGRSSVAGLWVVGEAASTGLHGANRLASNSLLEAAVMGMRAGEDIGGNMGRPAPVKGIGAIRPCHPQKRQRSDQSCLAISASFVMGPVLTRQSPLCCRWPRTRRPERRSCCRGAVDGRLRDAQNRNREVPTRASISP